MDGAVVKGFSHAALGGGPIARSSSRFLDYWKMVFAARRCKCMRGVKLDFGGCARSRFLVPIFGLPCEISRKGAKARRNIGNGWLICELCAFACEDWCFDVEWRENDGQRRE